MLRMPVYGSAPLSAEPSILKTPDISLSVGVGDGAGFLLIGLISGPPTPQARYKKAVAAKKVAATALMVMLLALINELVYHPAISFWLLFRYQTTSRSGYPIGRRAIR